MSAAVGIPGVLDAENRLPFRNFLEIEPNRPGTPDDGSLSVDGKAGRQHRENDNAGGRMSHAITSCGRNTPASGS